MADLPWALACETHIYEGCEMSFTVHMAPFGFHTGMSGPHRVAPRSEPQPGDRGGTRGLMVGSGGRGKRRTWEAGRFKRRI
jgi:hypothetical protein